MDTRPILRRMAELLERIEVDALVDLYSALSAYCPEYDAHVCSKRGIICCLLKANRKVYYNRILSFGVRQIIEEEELDRAISLLQEADLPILVPVSPYVLPPHITRWLAECGFRLMGSGAKLYRDLSTPFLLETKTQTRKITVNDRGLYADIMLQGFQMPEWMGSWFPAQVGGKGWTHYFAFDGDMPIAGGALFIRHGVGVLFGAATLPAYRRRGAQSALIACRIEAAMNHRCHWIVTETAQEAETLHNPSYHNLLRAGFRLAYLRPNYVRVPSE
jgi:ribosomal protein S18 acetylase RimI-like enzyme